MKNISILGMVLFLLIGCGGKDSALFKPETTFALTGESGITATGTMNPGAKTTAASRKDRVALAIKLIERSAKKK